MLTLGRAAYQKGQRYAEYAGLSTDDKVNNDVIVKPRNGDIFKEIDTGSVFKYNEESGQWVQQPSTGGGGSQTTGVTSFNGRTGAVTPSQGDYTAALVGAVDKAGDTMTGDLDMSGNRVLNVSSVKADGTYENAGIRFDSNGTIINFITGYSNAMELSANSVNILNHSFENVSEINMSSNKTINDAVYIGGNTEQNDRTCIDFNTQNAVGIWAEGTERVIIDANGVNVNGNDITGVSDIIADGSTTGGIKFESNGAIVGIICDGTRSATFTANTIDAYEHQITRVGAPTNDTDAARKIDVDAVQTAVDTVSETVDGIIDGSELIPYLPDNGGTLTGPLNMGNNKITMGGTPTETTDVTNKGYVDGVVGVVSNEVDKILDGTSPVALPIASETHLGGIKIGTGMSIEEDGTVNIVQTQQSLPMASTTELGVVKVGTGLIIEQDGSLEATAGLYRDAASGIVFVGPNTSKTMRLSESFQVLYGTEYGISSDALDPSWGGPFYINAGQSDTIGNLTVSFNQNGAEFTITNSHASVCYFFMYGGYSLPDTQ